MLVCMICGQIVGYIFGIDDEVLTTCTRCLRREDTP
jgi:predicted nucleic acid-binding Zn ribbon protein